MQENLDQGNKYCKTIERKIWWSLRCIFLIDQGRQVKSIFVMFVFNHYKIVVKQKKKPSRFSENAWTMVFLWNIYHIALLTFLRGKQKQNCLTCTIDCRHGSFVIDYLLSSRDPFTFFIYSVFAWLNTQVDNTWF